MAHRDLAGVHVLVVEDTDDSREMLRAALEYCGALVTTAEEAKRVLSKVRPHVLISDIAMPDDGLELIREVKTVAESKGLRFPPLRSPPIATVVSSSWPKDSRNWWRSPWTRLRSVGLSDDT